MLYMILGRDGPNADSGRPAGRERHLERIRQLTADGRLLLAGPLPAVDAEDPGPAGFHGSLIVAEFESLDAARAWADEDPYLATGAWEQVEVYPFRQVAP